jgi:DNA-binding transcriptional ArsR family regulator
MRTHFDARTISPTRQDRRTDALAVSHRRDTGTSNNISTNNSIVSRSSGIKEIEIDTAAFRKARMRRHGRFLKGPILVREIAVAARLRGQALALFLAIHHQTQLAGKTAVTLPSGLLTQLGIGKDAKSRGLRQLEDAGLVRVERSKGRTARMSLCGGQMEG